MREPKGRPPIEPFRQIKYDIGKRALGAPAGSVTISSLTDDAITTLQKLDLNEKDLLGFMLLTLKKINLHLATITDNELKDTDIEWPT